MFSAEDAKEVFELLALNDDPSSPLMLDPHGYGFVTRNYIRKAIEDVINNGKQTLYSTCSLD
jgi:hypothetical protein